MNEHFDLDNLEQDFEKEFDQQEQQQEESHQEDDQQQEEDQTETEEETEEETDSSEENDTEDDSTGDDKSQENNSDDQFSNDKQNRAFADMRREKEDLQRQIADMKKYSDVITDIANKSGVSTDELLQRYEQQKLEKEAQQQNVPVEFLQKQREMEQELSKVKEERFEERFNAQVHSVVEKYNLSNEDVQGTFKYAFQNGLDLKNPSLNFEAIYKAANFDKLMEQQLKADRQKQLEDKQKRMSKSSVTHGGSAAPDASLDDEVNAFLKEQGVI